LEEEIASILINIFSQNLGVHLSDYTQCELAQKTTMNLNCPENFKFLLKFLLSKTVLAISYILFEIFVFSYPEK